MPRKQRFKPTRKPKPPMPMEGAPQVDDRTEVHPDDVEIGGDRSAKSDVIDDSSQ